MPLRWLAAFAWVVFVAALSLIPQDAVPNPQVLGLDKIAHMIMYGVLAGLAIRELDRPSRRAIAVVVVACTVYGALLEVAQSLLPIGRCGSVADGIANALGAVAVGVYRMLSTGANRSGGLERVSP
jgi:VanZ family protein